MIGTHPLRGGIARLRHWPRLRPRRRGRSRTNGEGRERRRSRRHTHRARPGGDDYRPHASCPCRSFTAAAAELGFIVSADDPRRHVFACAGAPICSSAHVAARAIAPRITEAAAPYLGASFQIHLSGCAKGCAHAGSTALTIVGAPWRCGLIADGCARDIPFDIVPPDELPAAIARYARQRKREVSHV